jgi:predicted permease
VRRGSSPWRRSAKNERAPQALCRDLEAGVAVRRADAVIRDLIRAARALRDRPGFTLTIVVTLALGIGANAAIFSLVDASLLRPLPFVEPDRLVALGEARPSGEADDLAAPTFVEWRHAARSLEALAAWTWWGLALTGRGEPEELLTIRASPSLFPTLGAGAALGRTFAPEEEAPGRGAVVLLSDGLWRRRFGADPGILGRTLVLDGEPRTVVGVMPRGFRFPDAEIDLWIPLGFHDYERESRTIRMFNVIGRLAPGATIDGARAEMAAIAAATAAREPGTHRGWSAWVEPAASRLVNAPAALPLLLGAVGLVLLIACANVASLLLARGAERERDLAVRAALGAGRGRLARELLAEALVLAAAGGALGLLLSGWLVDLVQALDPEGLPGWHEVRVDGRAVAFTAAASLAAALLAGLVPALRAARPDLDRALREGSGRATARRATRAREALAVGETALAIVLVAGAGLLVQSLLRVVRTDPGFDSRRALVASLFLPGSRYDGPGVGRRFFEDLLARSGALPGVLAAGGVSALPLAEVGEDYDVPYRVTDRPPTSDESPSADFRVATTGYFRALGIPLVAGRDFATTDVEGAPAVAVVNRTLARRAFGERDPLGRRLTLERSGEEVTVVGVVGDVRHRGLDAEPRPEIYRPLGQDDHTHALTIVLRTAGPPLALADPLKRTVLELDPDLPISVLTTLEDLTSSSVASRRMDAAVLGSFAALALLLAALGLHGALAGAIAGRTRDIGIRMALGAGRRRVMREVVGRGLALAATGFALGLPAAVLLARVLRGMLVGVGPADAATHAGAAVVLLGTALLAAWLPARRAAGVDAAAALRSS